MKFMQCTKWIPITTGCGVLLFAQLGHANPIYVDGSVGSSGNGLSWSTAKKTVQEGIDAASLGEEVWVRAGVYKPGSTQEDTFLLADGVNVHGGFAGTEANRVDADPYVNLTYLSGYDVEGTGNHAYHVVTAIDTVEALTRLDGFIIEGGDANDDSNNRGGGLLVMQSEEEDDISLNVTRCLFNDNHAFRGGAVTVIRTAGVSHTTVNVELTNCEFTGNTANNGGAIWLSGSRAIITNSLFVGNLAVNNGGALHLAQVCNPSIDDCGPFSCFNFQQTSALVQNCTMTLNEADNFGGGIYSRRGILSLVVVGTILWENMDANSTTVERQQFAQDFYCEESGVSVTYTCIEADPLDEYASTGNIDDDPLFVNGYHLNSGSPCVDAGDIGPDFPQDDLDFDHDGNTTTQLAPDLDRFERIIMNEVDMGCYERLCVCLADFVTSATFAPPPDGKVDAADLGYLLGGWGPNPGYAADIVTSATFKPPPDGVVDAADLAYLLGSWGTCADPRTCQVEEMLGGGDPNPLEDEVLGPMLEELLETNDAELAEMIAALLLEWTEE